MVGIIEELQLLFLCIKREVLLLCLLLYIYYVTDILRYDITSFESFECVKSWVKGIFNLAIQHMINFFSKELRANVSNDVGMLILVFVVLRLTILQF